MAEITIRRCVMRVVRHGGWSWGPHPRRLAEDLMRVLPALLAAELARLLPDEAEGEIASPLRVAVKMGLPELRAWAAEAASATEACRADVPPPRTPPSSAPDAITAAIREALANERLAERVQVPVEAADALVTTPAGESHDRLAAVLRLLTAWHAAGTLDELLATLPQEVIAAWQAVLLESPLEPSLPTVSRGAGEDPDAVRRMLDLLRASRDMPSGAASSHLGPLTAARGRPAATSPVPLRTPRHRIGDDLRVDHALPFLLLGPLHRIGWLDVVEATLARAGLESTWPALAIALATKVLPEPERGWRRTPAAMAAAAAFAGDATLRPDAEVAELARAAAGLTRALDAVVQRSLLDGRDARDPLVLCAAGSTRLFVDPQGAFLVAHAADLDSASARARECHAPLFVAAEDADAPLLASLDQAEVTFVTPAPPTRGERWRPVPGRRSPRLYSNRIVHAFRAPDDDVTARAREVWRELERRPHPGRPADSALERSLALAAAMALATIAWELWRQRETTDATLALARFGDIPATVRFEEDRVRVRLPLGKRYYDLKDAGLLDDVPHVPWLGFRPVVFSGG